MSEAPHASHDSTPIAAQSAGQWRRNRFQGRGRLFRIAAFIVILAGIVLVVALIFLVGFVGGARNAPHNGGGGHHGAMVHAGLGP
jgi:hypothetical protein